MQHSFRQFENGRLDGPKFDSNPIFCVHQPTSNLRWILLWVDLFLYLKGIWCRFVECHEFWLHRHFLCQGCFHRSFQIRWFPWSRCHTCTRTVRTKRFEDTYNLEFLRKNQAFLLFWFAYRNQNQLFCICPLL